MKLTKCDTLPEQTEDQLFILPYQKEDEGLIQSLADKALDIPIALHTTPELYPSLVEKRETLPPIFITKDPIYEDLLLALATHFVSSGSEMMPKELIRPYIASLFDKYYPIEEKTNAYDGSLEKSLELKKLVHKFAGNTGSYGYTEASTYLRSIEHSISDDAPADKSIFTNMLTELREKLKKRDEDPQTTAKPQAQQPQQGEKYDLILVDDDKDLTTYIETLMKQNGYSILTYNDFQKAKDELMSKDALIVLFDITSDQPVDGYQLMELYNNDPLKKASTLTGFLTGKTSIEEKLKSIPHRVDFYLEKPVDYDLFLRHLQGIKGASIPTPVRTLVIDDDQDLCKQLQSASTPEITFHTLSDVEKLFETLLNIAPHIIYMDYDLQTIKGSDLVQLIRDDARFRGIPISILTGKDDDAVYRDAVAVNISHFIKKPVTPPLLLQLTLAFFRKQHFMRYLARTNPTYGILTHSELEHIYSTILPLNKQLSVAAIIMKQKEGTDFKAWLEAKKKFIQTLLSFFSTRIPFGLWNIDHIGAFSPNYNLQRFQLLFDNFLQLTRTGTEEKETPTIPPEMEVSIGFAHYPEDGANLDELLTKALQGAAPNITIAEGEQERGILPAKRRAMLISEDSEITNLLSFSLKQWNIEPAFYPEGFKAVEDLSKNLFKEEPDVIVLDFDLTFESGPLLLEKVGNLVGDRIPILILSTKQHERAITDSLQRGAYSYIAKPLNLRYFMNILIQAISG